MIPIVRPRSLRNLTPRNLTPRNLAHRLEAHGLRPAYAGGMLTALCLFFFLAATNTLSGWLYVMSGVGIALLGISIYLTRQSLKSLGVKRSPIEPIEAGQDLEVSLVLTNPTPQTKSLLQISDGLPLGKPPLQAIAQVPAQGEHRWIYRYPNLPRGLYRWNLVQLRSAAPLGLFWYRRDLSAPAKAIVYPHVLPLGQCPLLDSFGLESNPEISSPVLAQAASEGLTRALRPYRWGDSTRMIHWRTSARYGELRVRELEIFHGGREVVLALDSAWAWQDARVDGTPVQCFEQAVIALASLYRYARRFQAQVKIWTAGSGLVQSRDLRGEREVLEVLAAVQPTEAVQASSFPETAVIWLSQNPLSLTALPPGSRWLLWPNPGATPGPNPGATPRGDRSPLDSVPQASPASPLSPLVGKAIVLDTPLQTQLQHPL